MSTPEPYDLEAVYDEQIAPLMTQIIAICETHRIPMLASFAYAHVAGEHGPRLCTTTMPGRAPRTYRAALSTLWEPGSEVTRE